MSSGRGRSWLLAAIALGVFFRLFHADWKLYSFDETVTSLRASGYTLADFARTVAGSHAGVPIGAYERFQRPGDRASPANVVRSLRTEDPQHPPLYFLATLLTSRAVPIDTVFWRRFPAIVFGLAAIAAAYWLGRELFDDEPAARILAALVALSPFHATYAQQAREYSLLALLTFVSSALLLRTLRRGGTSVAAYALSIAAGLWTHPLFGFVAVAHATYAALPLSGARAKRRVGACVAIVAGALTFVPWMAVLLHNGATATTDTGWFRSGLTPALYAVKWFFNAGSVFFDLDYVSVLFAPLAAAAVALAALCAWVAWRRAPSRTWSFAVLLGGAAAAPMLADDLAFHFTYGVQARYLTPLWIAIEIVTAYGLRSMLGAPREAAFARAATVGLLLAGASSLGVSAFASSWWLASRDRELPAMASVLRETPGATIVAVDDDTYLLELLPLVAPSLRVVTHARFDARAFESAARPFAIGKSNEIEAAYRARVRRVPLPAVFPPAHDPLIARLRSAAAAQRGQTADDLALFTR